MTDDIRRAFEKWYRERFGHDFAGIADEDCDLEKCWQACNARWEQKLDEKVLAGILEECRGMMWDSSEQELTYTTQAIIKHMKGE